jgi:glyoxylase-like metal-dependent hydrolase (beta-lactamase superfamily II)/ferredoxin
MARAARRLAINAPGDLYVDDTCIDCGACRWIAGDTFGDSGDFAYVVAQPGDAAGRRRAFMALVACPTGSIGSEADARGEIGRARDAFPDPVGLPGDGVYHSGYHSPKSFGAASYLVVRPGGNVLVDSPRFHRGLVRRIEELGGVSLMFLTHRDDVAEHRRFRDHFACRRVIHASDVTHDTRDVEERIAGDDAVALGGDLLAIPTPGHTRGSMCLLYRERYLFSGDHAAYSQGRQQVIAFHDACWFDWHTQIASMERLLHHRFEHLLPGHGAPCSLPPDQMRLQIENCVARMKRAG